MRNANLKLLLIAYSLFYITPSEGMDKLTTVEAQTINLIHPSPFDSNMTEFSVPQAEIESFKKHLEGAISGFENYIGNIDSNKDTPLYKIALPFYRILVLYKRIYQDICKDPCVLLKPERAQDILEIYDFTDHFLKIIHFSSMEMLQEYDQKANGCFWVKHPWVRGFLGKSLYESDDYDSLSNEEKAFLLSGVHAYYLLGNISNLMTRKHLYECHILHIDNCPGINCDEKRRNINIDGPITFDVYKQ